MKNKEVITGLRIPPFKMRWKLFLFLIVLALDTLVGITPIRYELQNFELVYKFKLKVIKGKLLTLKL